MPETNDLLAALDTETLEALRPHLSQIQLERRQTLYEAGQTVEHAVFPIDCLVSLLGTTADGGSVELAGVSRKGLVGLPVLLAGETSHHAARVIVAGRAVRLPTRVLDTELARRPDLQRALLSWSCRLLLEVSQAVVCHRYHPALERLCAWFLRACTRLETERFKLTQEDLSELLGVPRTAVTSAALALQDAGAIRYRHGRIEIVNRRRIELSACDCHQNLGGKCAGRVRVATDARTPAGSTSSASSDRRI